MSRVREISGLSRFSCILSKALSRFSQKLISCRAVPEPGSRSSFVTCSEHNKECLYTSSSRHNSLQYALQYDMVTNHSTKFFTFLHISVHTIKEIQPGKTFSFSKFFALRILVFKYLFNKNHGSWLILACSNYMHVCYFMYITGFLLLTNSIQCISLILK